LIAVELSNDEPALSWSGLEEAISLHPTT
jgi:hypothetical protein